MNTLAGDQALVVIPTYNERDNVGPLSEQILTQYPAIDLLFIDDNSPDGTGALLDSMAAANARINVIHRAGKLGLGTAYIAGFKWALARQYQYVFEMDCDFSHEPKYLADFLEAIQHADVVLGSRYTVGVSVINWTMSRLLISKFATLYVRLITGMPASDATGGFKCFRRKVLEALDLDAVKSNGYSFQIEMTYYAWMKGFIVREIPIIFYERAGGVSKMNTRIAREAVRIVWRLWFTHLFTRKPAKTPFYQPGEMAKQ